MKYKQIIMEPDKKIALVAHDNKKREMVEWAKYDRDILARHSLYSTGTTRAMSKDFMISSSLMDGEYFRLVPDYDEYRTRNISKKE